MKPVVQYAQRSDLPKQPGQDQRIGESFDQVDVQRVGDEDLMHGVEKAGTRSLNRADERE